MSKTYTNLEDYLEALYSKSLAVFAGPAKVNLARYDVKFVESVYFQIQRNLALTEKQIRLASSLLIKYERQLRKAGIELVHSVLTVTRLGTRVISDRTSIDIYGDEIRCYFPYSPALIGIFKAIGKDSQGALAWAPTERCWIGAATEQNVVTFGEVAIEGKIPMGNDFADRLTEIHAAIEEQPEFMTLCVKDGVCDIPGAEETLLSYLASRVPLDNVVACANMASALEVMVSKEITELVASTYGKTYANLVLGNGIYIGEKEHDEELMAWIRDMQTYPVAFIGGRFTEPYVRSFFPEEEILNGVPDAVNRADGAPVLQNNAVTLFNGSIDHTAIPKVVVLGRALMFGRTRTKILDQAEKIVWGCQRIT